ncbi:DUF2285 domain-containing protein [Sphingomonas sabuli]|uniref:DUF2285 domain-containing protein n=1 Tax=Sphingomonas sabuli TaxID=2764186 RepID=A0A7G9L3Z1_9SPHN|nr:DUF2285 domain-containing protein [Sphingomonas sabuli]QNM83340.1 DUF2285 domain-containing protein [Sphingomonas sabuli]
MVDADRSLICWEWLRRDPAYRAAFIDRERPARDWGLVRFEDPDFGVPDARPMWSGLRHPGVLRCGAEKGGRENDLIDLGHPLVTGVEKGPLLHCCVSDGLRSLRLDVEMAGTCAGQVQLRYHLSGIASLDRPLATLGRLRRFARSGHIPAEPGNAHLRARMILQLRAFDAFQAGASQRDLALTLLDPSMQVRGWRIDQPHLRSRSQRLVKSAQAMASGGYWALLQ